MGGESRETQLTRWLEETKVLLKNSQNTVAAQRKQLHSRCIDWQKHPDTIQLVKLLSECYEAAIRLERLDSKLTTRIGEVLIPWDLKNQYSKLVDDLKNKTGIDLREGDERSQEREGPPPEPFMIEPDHSNLPL